MDEVKVVKLKKDSLYLLTDNEVGIEVGRTENLVARIVGKRILNILKIFFFCSLDCKSEE